MEKKVKGYPDYTITDNGVVKYKGDPVPITHTKNGHRWCWFYSKKEGRKALYIHRVVYMTFVGNLMPAEVVHHVDCDNTNNSCQNLEKMTRADHSKYHRELSIGLKHMQEQMKDIKKNADKRTRRLKDYL